MEVTEVLHPVLEGTKLVFSPKFELTEVLHPVLEGTKLVVSPKIELTEVLHPVLEGTQLVFSPNFGTPSFGYLHYLWLHCWMTFFHEIKVLSEYNPANLVVTDTPVSLDGTQFCAIIATLKLGMKQGLQSQN